MSPSEIAKAVEVARQHEAGHDADMRDEPECQRCRESLRSNEPSAFCGWCIYLVADDLAAALLALAERCGELEARAASFVDAVNAAVRANEQRGKGGQQVLFHGDFASATRNLASSLRWAAFGQAMFDAGREYHAAASDDEPWRPNTDGRALGCSKP